GKYNKDDFHEPVYFQKENSQPDYSDETSFLNAASIWLTFEAMEEAARPDEDAEWKQFSSSTKIAWKTGTSFGNRDAWAIGVTPDFVVAVWAGNASGEGRAGCIGLQAAAPILFDIFKLLKPTDWFQKPESEMVEIPVCRYSGYRASSLCELTDSIWIPAKCLKTAVCPYHIIVHLDQSGNRQVNSNCTSTDSIVNTSWFVLPPAQEWYFKNKNAFYKTLPPFKDGCLSASDKKSMEMIYPENNSKIYIPVDIDGKPGSTVFKLAHHIPEAVVYWTLDNSYLGSTTKTHQMELKPDKGKHSLTVVDKQGESLTIKFTVESKKDDD
ncbi:MAG: penicillin-binding protein 1C, partial [Bacteroidota bacterium]